MTVRTVPGYEVICDEPGCGTKTGDVGGYSLWGDSDYAEEDWVNADGQIIEDKHFCSKHRKPECCGCESISDLKEGPPRGFILSEMPSRGDNMTNDPNNLPPFTSQASETLRNITGFGLLVVTVAFVVCIPPIVVAVWRWGF